MGQIRYFLVSWIPLSLLAQLLVCISHNWIISFGSEGQTDFILGHRDLLCSVCF